MTSLSNGLYRPEPEEALHLITLPLETFAPEEQSAPKMTEEALQENSGIREEVQSEPKKEPEQEERRLPAKAEKEEAERIIRQAKIQAQQLLQEARQQAKEVKDQASKDGYTEGWKKGCDEGRTQARQEAEAEHAQQKKEFHEMLAGALEAIEQEKKACLQRYLEELKDVAVAVGEKVIRVSLRSSGAVIRRMIESETEKLSKMAWVRIHMEHNDYETMIQADAEVLSHLARLSDNVKFVVMEQASGGSCIIEMPDEIIDISVDTQLENIRKLLGNIHF